MFVLIQCGWETRDYKKDILREKMVLICASFRELYKDSIRSKSESWKDMLCVCNYLY